MRHSCSVSSCTGAMSPYSPTFSPASFLPLIDVETKTSSPQTTGLERPRPGIGVFHATFVPSATFQVAGSENPSATPRGADAAELRPVDSGRGAGRCGKGERIAEQG